MSGELAMIDGGAKVNCQARIRQLTRLALAYFAGLLLFAPGCSKKEAQSTEVPGTTTQPKMPVGSGLPKSWGLRVKDRPGTIFHVEYSDNTSIVDKQTVARTFRGVSDDHRIFFFEDSPELRQKLVPGKFVLFEGLDLRKVDALAVKDKYLIIGTETAPLPEALKYAQIQWKAPVDFDELFDQLSAQRQAASPPSNEWASGTWPYTLWDMIQPTAHATFTNSEIEGEVEIADSDFNTWKVHYHFTRQPGFSSSKYFPKPSLTGRGLDMDLQLEREGRGMSVGIHIQGHLTKYEQMASILMADGSIQHAYLKNVGLHGNADLDWEISTTENKTSMHEIRIKLPGMTVPLEEFDGLPMSLKISAALLFHPAFTTKAEIAKGGFRVTYSGDEGFQLGQGDMEQDGDSEGDAEIGETTAFAPFAAYGVVLAVAAPRVELKAGTEEVWEMLEIPLPHSLVESATDLLLHNPILGLWNPNVGNPLAIEGAAYFQVVTSTTASHSGMQSLVPCQQFTMLAKGQVGVDAKWFGTDASVAPKDIFTKNLVLRKPDSKICGGG